MPALPLILAGPIVRRVEPRLVTVWVALSEPHSLLLVVYDGRQVAGTGTTVFTGGSPLVIGGANTLRAGEKLHVGVVVAELKAPALPLNPGRNYSYNLQLGDFATAPGEAAVLDPAGISPRADLRSLGLLGNQPVSGRAHLALGYEEGELPGFALPPASLTDLRMIHGSCRRPGFIYEGDDGKTSYDALAYVDDLIAAWRRGSATTPGFDANKRPHQLFLTGDQIYADDVAAQMLPMLNLVGNDLLGKVEQLPTRYPPKADDASREAYLGAPKPANFTSIQAFVDKQKTDGKDPLEALKADRRVRALADPAFDRKFTLLYGRPYTVDASVPADRTWPADLRHFPAGRRLPVLETESKFSTVDLENHLISFGEYCAMYLTVWSNAAWTIEGAGRPKLASLDDLFGIPAGPLPQIWDLNGCFEDRAILRTDITTLAKEQAALRKKADESGSHARRINTLTTFFDSLPRVRRALANVPTYMVFDDHDVTDDWNIGRAWRDQVHTTLLGRRIITSALVAYALFQDWGNDPLRYRAGPWKTLLDQAVKLFPPGAAPAMPAAATTALEKLFGLNQPDPEVPAPVLKWHFGIDGPRHRVIALDTRTRRRFRSRHLPPGLLSPQALEEQLPDPVAKPLPAGMEVLVVLSQTPVGMPALAASVIVPVMGRVQEFKNRGRWRNLPGLEPDNEIWPGDDAMFDAVLRRLAAYKRVVVLSGEVHWGSSAQISYWKRGPRRLDLAAATRTDLDNQVLTPALRSAFTTAGITLSTTACVETRPGTDEWLVIDPPARRMFLVRAEADGLHVSEEEEPARLAQFTSSGMKNIKALIAGLARSIGFAFSLLDVTPAERLVWLDSTPPPLEPPAGGRFPPAVRDRLGSDPVTVPSGNWPPGTVVTAPPDFCWRLDMVRDERPEAQRPDFLRVDPLPGFDNTTIEQSYARIASRHASHFTSGKLRFGRGAIYQSHLGLVRFERDGTDLVACHDVYSHPPGRDEVALAAVHRVPLQRFGERRPQMRFDTP